MGCQVTTAYQPPDTVETDIKQLHAHLSQRQIQLVRDCWDLIADDMASTGIIIFTRLFQLEKGLKPLFLKLSKKDASRVDNPMDHHMLQTHSMVVMQSLGAAVESLEDSQLLTETLSALGSAHVGYNVKPAMLLKLWPAIQYGLQQKLQDVWTEEVEEAWRKVFVYIVATMHSGMKQRAM